MKNLMVVLLAFASLSACTPGWKSQSVPLTFSQKIFGVWMPKIEAEELRTKGNIDSRCADVLKDPSGQVLNTRSIELNGDLFMYDPDAKGVEAYKMGTISADGVVTYAGKFVDAVKDYKSIKVSIEDDVLTITYEREDASDYKAVYLRSNEKETRENLAAQKTCRK